MQSRTKIEKSKSKTPEQALSTLEWLCSKMERSASDARRSLYRWGITECRMQDCIIEKLRTDGFIDHRRYAGAYVRDKMIGGRWGEAKIRAGLRAKAIESYIIDEAIEQNFEKENADTKLETNLRRQYEKEKPKAENNYKLRAKLFRRAASQGFDIDTINAILERIFNEKQ